MPKFREISNTVWKILLVSITEGSVSTNKKGKIDKTPAISNNIANNLINNNNKASFRSLGNKIYK